MQTTIALYGEGISFLSNLAIRLLVVSKCYENVNINGEYIHAKVVCISGTKNAAVLAHMEL